MGSKIVISRKLIYAVEKKFVAPVLRMNECGGGENQTKGQKEKALEIDLR